MHDVRMERQSQDAMSEHSVCPCSTALSRTTRQAPSWGRASATRLYSRCSSSRGFLAMQAALLSNCAAAMLHTSHQGHPDRDFASWRIPKTSRMFESCVSRRLYFGIGKKFNEDNIVNIAAVLFMFTTLPGFAAAAYTPAIVLERPLFARYLYMYSAHHRVHD